MLLQSFPGDLARGGENAQGDGQVEAAALLGQVGRCQVHGDASVGKGKVRIEDGAAHPVLAFADRGFRQADDVKGRQAVGEVGLDLDQRRFHAGRSAAVDDR